MRLQISHELMTAMTVAEHIQLRQMMKILCHESLPGWATAVKDQPNIYEFTVHSLWVRYLLKAASEEEGTVIQAALIQQPSL